MRDGEAPDILEEMCLNLARHDLEVTLKRTKEQCFRAAKEIASESIEGARKVDSSLKRKGASSEHAKEGAAEGVQFNAQWHQLATRVEASSVHRTENSSAGEDVLEGVGEEVNSEKAVMASAGMQARLGR